jgi:8-oxo-dGTP pyrophosphatase MutT (NUDIX family)
MTQPPAWLRPHGTPWTRLSERIVFENPWLRLTEHEAVAPTGRPAQYGLVGMKNLALAILPLHDDGTVILVGQHRFAFADYSWEIPEGGGPLDVDPLESAKRELAEETGLQAIEWRQVLRLQLSNSITDERALGYVALGLSEATEAHHADDTEALTMVRVPFREALDAALAGHLQDVLTVAMLLRAYHMAREGALPGALARGMLG